MKTIAQILAANLAERRKAMGLTQQQLADIAGIDISTIARWEMGDRWPRLVEIQNIAAILKIDPAALYQAQGISVSPTPEQALEVLQGLVRTLKPGKTAPRLTPIQAEILAAVRGLDEEQARNALAQLHEAQKPRPTLQQVPTPKDELVQLINSLTNPDDVAIALRQVQTVHRLRIDGAQRNLHKRRRN